MIGVEMVADAVSPEGARITTLSVTAPSRVIAQLQQQRDLTVTLPVRTMPPAAHLIYLLACVANTPVTLATYSDGLLDFHLARIAKTHSSARDSICKLLSEWRANTAQPFPVELAEELLTPWLHRTALVTATTWDILDEVRKVSPEMDICCGAIFDTLRKWKPRHLGENGVYMPLVGYGEIDQIALEAFADALQLKLSEQAMEACVMHMCLKIATARYARFGNGDLSPTTVKDDLDLYDTLSASGLQQQYFGHAATPDVRLNLSHRWKSPELHGNFVGWLQYRRTVN